MSGKTTTYRSDIQIMRGLAVLVIFFYHLKIHFFQSGFIGVDVFFVISGYLIGKTMQDTDWASIRGFYGRRAKRILPVYFFVQILLLLAFPLLFLPFEIKEYLGSLPYFITGIPNVGFWRDNTYFATFLFRPTLHFWALGVEIQFYLLFPLLLLCHKKNKILLALITLASLACCIVMMRISPKTAFFLTPFRLWEFMAGFYICQFALFESALEKRPWLRPLLFYAATVFIIFFSIIPIPERHFPWFYAFPVVIASIVFIAANYNPLSTITKLVFTPLERIGEWSYSIYLLHFPIIFIVNYKPFKAGKIEPMGASTIICIFAVTLLLSMLIYKYIETPFRKFSFANRRIFIYSFISLASILLIIGWLVAMPISRARSTSNTEINKVFFSMEDKGVDRCSKIQRITQLRYQSCIITKGNIDETRPIGILMGDSHANAIKEVLTEEADKAGVALLLMQGNCRLGERKCAVDSLRREIESRGIDFVILHWTPGGWKDFDSLRQLIQIGHKLGVEIIFIDPVPDWDVNIPEVIYQSIIQKDKTLMPRSNFSDYLLENRNLFAELDQISSDNFRRYKIGELFCTPNCALFDADGYLLYNDSNHLTLHGTEFLRPLAKQIFDDVKAHFQNQSN